MFKIKDEESLLISLRENLENPKQYRGIRGFLKWRIDSPDVDNVKETNPTHLDKYYKSLYGLTNPADEPGSSDVIFNCWSVFRILLIAKVGKLPTRYKNGPCAYALDYLDDIFQGFEDFP